MDAEIFFEGAALTIGAFAVIWAIVVLIRESIMKANLQQLSLEDIQAKRRQQGRAEEATLEEQQEALRRLAVVAALYEDEGFKHRSDILFAYEQLMIVQRLLPTNERVVSVMNDATSWTRYALQRYYVMWESGFWGKLILIGAVVVAVLSLIYFPWFSGLLLPPVLLYPILGRTPIGVARNPGKLDGCLTGAVAGLTGGAIFSLPSTLDVTETKWVRKDTNEVVRSEMNYTGFGAIVAILIFAVIAAVLIYVRLIVMFVRNFMLYR